MNYQQACEKLTGRCVRVRKLKNNTYLERLDNESIAVRLHSTNVLVYKADGSVIIDSGGWRTVTTKGRMNEYLPYGFRISQTRGQWYLGNYTQKNRELCLFEDGLIVRPNGTFEGGTPISDAEKLLRDRRKVQAYAKRFIEAMRAGKVQAPSAGDCFYCQMRVESPEKDKGKTLGEAFRDRSHIELHIEESYFVPSLLWRAIETFPSSQAMKWAIGELWGAARTPEGELLEKIDKGWASHDFVWDGIRKNLSRYILRQIGQAS